MLSLGTWSRSKGTVLILAVAVTAAALMTSDLRAFVEPDLDNSLPIETIAPKVDLNANGNEPVHVIVTDRTRNAKGDWELQCLLLNTGKVPIYYSGYLPTSYNERPPQGLVSPIKRVQERKQIEWEDVKIGYCGTGMGTLRLQPGQGGRFFVYRKNSPLIFRIGISYAVNKEDPKSTVVWSAETPVVGMQ